MSFLEFKYTNTTENKLVPTKYNLESTSRSAIMEKLGIFAFKVHKGCKRKGMTPIPKTRKIDKSQ
jgi:hypothetical protein